ncbi:hypothetical protein A7M93_19880 [Acinetobacter baumannii]|nr:hypothetical protein A7M93_19880 [Acinetobacter baumannii]
MSGDHAKKEMETGDKPATSHGKAPSKESRNKKKGKEKKASSHKSHRSGDKIKEDEEGGLLRDRHFITFYLRLRRALHNF